MFPLLLISEEGKLARRSKARRYRRVSCREMRDDLRRRCLAENSHQLPWYSCAALSGNVSGEGKQKNGCASLIKILKRIAPACEASLPSACHAACSRTLSE